MGRFVFGGPARLSPQVLAVSAVCLLALTGCTQSEEGAVKKTEAKPAPHLLVGDWKNGDDAMLAMRGGVLIVQDDGCVGMRPEGGGNPAVIRWPAGTRLAPDGKAVIGKGGTRIEFGKVTAFGGGFAGKTLPAECDGALWGSVYELQDPI